MATLLRSPGEHDAHQRRPVPWLPPLFTAAAQMLALIVTRTAGWTALSRLPPSRWRVNSFATMTGADGDGALEGGASAERTLEPGTVYVVATPIGNLEDLTLRAIRTLRQDVVASEDTRVTLPLLRHLGAQPSALLSHHEHNLRTAIPKLLEHALAGRSVAVVSDAGTPGISDPGAELAAACAERGVPRRAARRRHRQAERQRVSRVGYVFLGFLPRTGKAPKPPGRRRRRRRAPSCCTRRRTGCSPRSATSPPPAPPSAISCARELDEAPRGAAPRHRRRRRRALRRVGGGARGRVRGEFTLVLAPIGGEETARRAAEELESQQERAAAMVAERLAAGEVGLARREGGRRRARPHQKEVYTTALRLKEELDGECGAEARIRFHSQPRPSRCEVT